MCFSAEASFTVGAALIPAGAYCLWSAAVKKPSHLGLAAVPLIFGLQQISEGFVWLGLHRLDAELTRSASLAFLFFALAFWPFWFPTLTTLMEPVPRRRLAFGLFSVLASGWFWVLYFPLLVGPAELLRTTIEHHSIAYQYPDLAIYEWVPRNVLRVLYFLSVALPLLLSSETWGKVPGLVLGVSAVIAAVAYHHAFVSVWCFFAAVLAGYLCVVFYRMPQASATAALFSVGGEPQKTHG